MVRLFWGRPRFGFSGYLRATCGTYLTNAPGIFRSGSVFLSARQLGHSVAVAEKHYLGVHRGIPASATTLEAAMEIGTICGRVLANLHSRPSAEGWSRATIGADAMAPP